MKLAERIIAHPFYKSFLLLSSGSLLAQFIILLSYPFVARLFTPENFGIKALFASTFLVLTSVSTGKYELAVPIPKKHSDAFYLTILSILLSLLFSILLLSLLFLPSNSLISFLGLAKIEAYLWILPLGVFVASLYNTLVYWMVRFENYKTISQSRVVQAIMKTFCELVGGFLQYGPIVLILGLIIGQTGGLLAFGRKFLTDLKEKGLRLGAISKAPILKNMTTYNSFPKFSVFSGLLNKLNYELPIFFLAMYYSIEFTGQYSIALILIAISGVALVEPFSQIYLSELPKKRQESKAAALDYFKTSFYRVVKLSVLPTIGIAVFGYYIITIALGQQWEIAGQLSIGMSLLIPSNFLLAFAFHTFNIIDQQRTRLMLDIFRILLIIVSFSFVYQKGGSAQSIIYTFVGISVAISIVQTLVAYKLVLAENYKIA